jgi:hypothetical protein
MKKILTLAAVMVFAASAAFAADLPYEMDPGNGGGGSDDTPTDVALTSSAGRDLPYENGGTDDPDDDDSDVSLVIGRILSLIGITR